MMTTKMFWFDWQMVTTTATSSCESSSLLVSNKEVSHYLCHSKKGLSVTLVWSLPTIVGVDLISTSLNVVIVEYRIIEDC